VKNGLIFKLKEEAADVCLNFIVFFITDFSFKKIELINVLESKNHYP